MEKKDNHLLPELLFTFLLLLSAVLLFGGALSQYGLYLAAGAAAGFYFSWLNRKQPQTRLMGIFVNVSSAGIFVWLIYSLTRPSFSYPDTILLFIKAIVFLSILFSFNGHFASSLTSIQTLSLALLMCFPLFLKGDEEFQALPVLIYFACWLAILRIKFHTALRGAAGDSGRFYSLLVSLSVFLIIISVSWILSRHFLLDRTAKEGFLSGKTEIQDKISKLLPNLKNKEERQEALYLLSLLIKKSPDVMEIKRAQDGLIDILKRPGPGLEEKDAKALVILLKSASKPDKGPQIKSLDSEKKEKEKKGAAVTKVGAASFITIIKAVFSLFFLSIMLLFAALHLIINRKKSRLVSCLLKNPRQFIISLYENAQAILTIFGPGQESFRAPLSYARWVEDKYSIGNNLFLRFTLKFQEAKYSRHVFASRDALLALDDYNFFLKSLFHKNSGFDSFLGYCLSLLQGKPLFIRTTRRLKNLAIQRYLC